MMKNWILIGLGAAFGLVGGAALVGRAHAQAPGPRFAYKCITGLPMQAFKPEAQAALNREGADGWRLLDGLSAHNHLTGGDQYCFIKQY
jgi:hypothetical protein